MGLHWLTRPTGQGDTHDDDETQTLDFTNPPDEPWLPWPPVQFWPATGEHVANLGLSWRKGIEFCLAGHSRAADWAYCPADHRINERPHIIALGAADALFPDRCGDVLPWFVLHAAQRKRGDGLLTAFSA